MCCRIDGESELSAAKEFGPFFCTFADFPRGREATLNQVMAAGGRLSQHTGNEAHLLGRGAPARGVPPLLGLFVFLPVSEATGRKDERVDEQTSGGESRGLTAAPDA